MPVRIVLFFKATQAPSCVRVAATRRADCRGPRAPPYRYMFTASDHRVRKLEMLAGNFPRKEKVGILSLIFLERSRVGRFGLCGYVREVMKLMNEK